MRSVILAALFAALVFAQASPQDPPGAQAQSPNADGGGCSLLGIVTDWKGAPVPKATVIVTQIERMVGHLARTDDAGRYAVTNLLAGSYSLTVRASGFPTYTNAGVELVSGQKATLDVALQIGNVVSSENRERAFRTLQGLTKTASLGACAVPLKNVLPGGAPAVEAMKTFPPSNPGRFPMKEATLPAPSCVGR
jgi:hypothetical protein